MAILQYVSDYLQMLNDFVGAIEMTWKENVTNDAK